MFSVFIAVGVCHRLRAHCSSTLLCELLLPACLPVTSATSESAWVACVCGLLQYLWPLDNLHLVLIKKKNRKTEEMSCDRKCTSSDFPINVQIDRTTRALKQKGKKKKDIS